MKKSDLIASFADVISCDLCDEYTSQKLLRDNLENVPQPGYIGKDYEKSKLLLVGQNPGLAPDRMLSRDKIYTKSLRDLASLRTIESYDNFYETVVDFVPEWPVNRNYFPLEECDLSLDDIAYCNVVRCRTQGNAAPSKRLITNCSERHFVSFLNVVNPSVVIFIGKWAHDNAAHLLPKGTKHSFMNRMRSLRGEERLKNRSEVVSLVKLGLSKNA